MLANGVCKLTQPKLRTPCTLGQGCLRFTCHPHKPQHHVARRLVPSAAASKSKQHVSWICTKCGEKHFKRQGRCRKCSSFELEEFLEDNASNGDGGGAGINLVRMATSELGRPGPGRNAQYAAGGARSTGTAETASHAHASSSAQACMPGSTDTNASGIHGHSFDDMLSPTGRSMGWVQGKRRTGDGASSGSGTGRSAGAVSMSQLHGSRRQRVSRVVLSGRTGREINRVLGGGVVPGSLVLVGGDPGIGKSTLLLQIAAMLAQPDLDFDAIENGDEGSRAPTDASGGGDDTAAEEDGPEAAQDEEEEGEDEEAEEEEEEGEDEEEEGEEEDASQAARRRPRTRTVLYVSGEEMEEQVGDRGSRMGLHRCSSLYVRSECKIGEVVREALALNASALVVDSIQTMYIPALPNPVGSIVQVKECGSALLRLAKDAGVTVFVIGHVTKGGDIAGPRALEHQVDCVLYLEGDSGQTYRLLRGVKNRYGPTDEIGVFRMDGGGLHAVEDPNALLLAARSQTGASSVVSCLVDGSRPLMLEVQALCTPHHPRATSPPLRQFNGVQRDRFHMLTAVVDKYVGRLWDQNILVSVVGGLQMRETAADLAIALAIASSRYSRPVPHDVAAVGEVDLGGGLRPVRRLDMRLAEVAKLGFKRCVIPQTEDVAKLGRDPKLRGLELLPCASLREAVEVVIGALPQQQRRRGGGRRRRGGGDDEGLDGAEGSGGYGDDGALLMDCGDEYSSIDVGL